MSKDAIVLLYDDHRDGRTLLPDIQATSTTYWRKGAIAQKVIGRRSVHTYIENVTRHMDEEEQDWFPKVRKALGRRQFQDIGGRPLESKEKPPRSPLALSPIKIAVDAVRS